MYKFTLEIRFLVKPKAAQNSQEKISCYLQNYYPQNQFHKIKKHAL